MRNIRRGRGIAGHDLQSQEETNMKKLALLAGAGLVAFGSIGTAEAQRRFNGDGGMRQGGNWNRTANWDRGNWNRGNWNRGYRDGYPGSTGGALAAGFV